MKFQYSWLILQQEDIRNYIDESLKQGFQLSLFRKQRIGGDSHGISYWYVILLAILETYCMLIAANFVL